MGTLSRLWKHLTTTASVGRRAFPQETLNAIQQAIADGERQHRAEVRVVIEADLRPWQVLQGETSRMRAQELFAEHGVWDTEENTGILVYILLADHKVEILPDRAVKRALTAEQWLSVCRTMTEAFRQGRYHDGVLSAIQQLNTMLAQHFPDDGSSHDQLVNEPLVL